MPIHDESLVLANLVVKQSALGVRGVSQPVHAGGFSQPRGFIAREDQLAADALAPKILDGEQVLQIAHVAQSGSTPMKEVVNGADDATMMNGDERVHRFLRGEESLPCCGSNLLG